MTLSQDTNDPCRKVKDNYAKTIIILNDVQDQSAKKDTIIDLQDKQIETEKKLGKKKRNRWVKTSAIEGVVIVFLTILLL